MKKTLSRYKNKKHPSPRPDTIEDIRTAFLNPNIIQDYAYNYERDARFYINTVTTPDYSFTLFVSQFTIDFVEKNIKRRKYLMDGTFDSLPEGFYQLLIIAIEYRNDVSRQLFVKSPVIFCTAVHLTGCPSARLPACPIV